MGFSLYVSLKTFVTHKIDTEYKELSQTIQNLAIRLMNTAIRTNESHFESKYSQQGEISGGGTGKNPFETSFRQQYLKMETTIIF